MTAEDITRPERPDSLPAEFPLTDLQAAYMVGRSRLMELGGRQNFYLEVDSVGLDPVRLEQAVNLAVRRHEHLRTLMLDNGRQRPMPAATVPRVGIRVADFTGMDGASRDEAVRRVRDRMCDAGLDPTGWPLFEIVVSRLRPLRSRLHIRMSLILLDGASINAVVDDIWQFYQDPAVELPPVEQTFREWRLGRLARQRGAEHDKHWEYWSSRLDTLPEGPQLPLARQASSIDAVWFTGRRTNLTKRQWKHFCANFRKHRVLPTTALLHVYCETLGAWAASPRFCLNFVHTFDLTYRPGVQQVVGQRSATLPLEVDLGRDGTFWERAQRLQRQLWQDMAHNDITAVRVSRELAKRHGWTQRVAFPYVFTNNQGPSLDSRSRSRPAFRFVERVQHTPQVLVDNQIRDAPDGGVSSNLDFVEEGFPEGLPAMVADIYRRALESLSRPEGADTEPDFVPAGHRALIAEVNGAGRELPGGRLEDGFLDRCSEDPGATAVVAPDRTLSYGELEALSRTVAHRLRAAGVGRGDVVPMVMVKGWQQVVAVLGVLRSGAAYCPVDAALPTARIGHLLEECSARVVLTQSGGATDLGTARPLERLAVDRLEPIGTPLPRGSVDGSPADLAYVIHTSGSTGRPKGVMIEHPAALNTIADVNARIGLGRSDRVFGISSLSFDLSVWDVFGTLRAGATLVLPRATEHPDPTGWAKTARTCGVTVWNSVPALAEMLVEVSEQRPEIGVPPLRRFLLSGDWIPPTLPDRMRLLWPEVGISALGGATEAAIWSNVYEVEGVDPSWRSIPYGKPLKNQTMKVLDHRLDIRAPWAVGRIFIGGAGLARGYWRDEERTAARFIHHPDTGERLYDTGDLGRYWPDGTIEFLGREDRQVKIQGFRVEPGEVEAAIRTHPGVGECAVAVRPGPAGQPRLLAFVVPVPGSVVDAASVTGHVRDRLPHYMVPGSIHVLDRLPLTPNGKVDIGQAIEAVAEQEPAAPAGRAASSVSRRLSELWAEVLQVPHVGPESDFFALGGDSLLALRMVSRIRVEFGVDVPMGRVFEAPTVRELADLVEHDGRPASCMVPLSAGDGDGDGNDTLFLFPILGGSVKLYLPVTEVWRGPVRAFQSRPLVDRSEAAFAPDLETVAATYREELQRVQPSGPYLLGGASTGGSIAYEVARQLAAQGHQSTLFMIDSQVGGIQLPSSELDRHLAFLRTLRIGPPPADAEAALRAGAEEDLARIARDGAVRHGLLPAEVDVDGYLHMRRIADHELALLAAYRPEPLKTPTLLIVASDEPERPDTVQAWQSVCPELEVQYAPGDHFSMLRPDRMTRLALRAAGWIAARRAGKG